MPSSRTAPFRVLSHSYLTSGSSLVGLLGRYFFTRLLRVGTEAGRLENLPDHRGAPASTHPSAHRSCLA